MSDCKVSLKKPGFAFFEVVEVLATMFEVHADRRDTFVSRLQQLQKMGLPGNANVGRGAKVRYMNWQLAEMALMLDLLDCGLTPGMLRDYFVPHERNYIGVYSMGGYGLQVQNSLDDAQSDLWWLPRFNALGYLKRPKKKDGQDGPHSLDRVDMGRSSENVIEELSAQPGLAVNLTAQLGRLRSAVAAVYPDRMEDVTFYPTRSGLKET